MTTQMQTYLNPDIISNIVLKGDISGLSQIQKVEYYNHVCNRLNIDPSTQPFQLLRLNGKEVMYATKSAAEQLTKLYGVSHEIKNRETIQDVHIVYARAVARDGRYEDSSGAVSIGNLKGDALANALMKAETKAKRRATLSLLGLSMLDESEIETIPNAQPAPVLSIVQPEPEKVVEVKAEEVQDPNIDGLKQELETLKPVAKDKTRLLAIFEMWSNRSAKNEISPATWAHMQSLIVARRKQLFPKKGE